MDGRGAGVTSYSRSSLYPAHTLPSVPPCAHLWVLQHNVAKHEAQANLCHLSEICCAIGQVQPGPQAIKQAAHTFKELPHTIYSRRPSPEEAKSPWGKSKVRFGLEAREGLYIQINLRSQIVELMNP